MRNRDMPAYAEERSSGFGMPETQITASDEHGNPVPVHMPAGLTKREAAAIAAMQGYCANGVLVEVAAKTATKNGREWWEQISIEAVTVADALFDALEKEVGE